MVLSRQSFWHILQAAANKIKFQGQEEQDDFDLVANPTAGGGFSATVRILNKSGKFIDYMSVTINTVQNINSIKNLSK